MTIPNVQHFFEPLSARRRSNIENLFDNFLSDFYISSLPNIKWEGQFLLPRLDVIETESNYQMDLEMPGIEQKNIDINVENNTLTIRGKKVEKQEKEGKDYYIRECYYGTMQRAINLPSNIDADEINAIFENGVLYLKIPKKEKGITKRIEIKS